MAKRGREKRERGKNKDVLKTIYIILVILIILVLGFLVYSKFFQKDVRLSTEDTSKTLKCPPGAITCAPKDKNGISGHVRKCNSDGKSFTTIDTCNPLGAPLETCYDWANDGLDPKCVCSTYNGNPASINSQYCLGDSGTGGQDKIYQCNNQRKWELYIQCPIGKVCVMDEDRSESSGFLIFKCG